MSYKPKSKSCNKNKDNSWQTVDRYKSINQDLVDMKTKSLYFKEKSLNYKITIAVKTT